MQDKMKMMWIRRTTPSGEVRFVPIIKKKTVARKVEGTIHATLTSKVVQKKQTFNVVNGIKQAGGLNPVVNGRRLTVEANEENIESIGDILESFGCQWDLY